MSALDLSYGETLEVSTSHKDDYDLTVCREIELGSLCKFKGHC